jgi:hypothetical protein
VDLKAITAAMVTPGFVRGMTEHTNAIWAAQAMESDGHEVVIVTSHFDSSPTWVYERTKWLEERLPGVPVIYTHDKHLVPGDALVEDTPRNLVQWLAAHPSGRGWLVRRPWNQYFRETGAPEHPGADIFMRTHYVNHIEEVREHYKGA